MLDALERSVFACRACYDFGKVYDGHTERACPNCGGWASDFRDTALRAETARRTTRPEITERDLTAEEVEVLVGWRIDHPKAHGLTLLSWIEGRRYAPREDAELLTLVDRRLRKERFLRGTRMEGPLPSRIRNAIKSGETKHLEEWEREYVESVGRERA